MVTRRQLLAGSCTTIVASGGCLTDRLNRQSESDGGAPEWCPPDDPDYRCAEGDPIDVRENFDDDEDVQYHENGTVDFRIGTTVDGPVYEPIPFEEWADLKCPSAGGNAAIDRIVERLGDDEGLVSTEVRSDVGPDGETAATVLVYTGEGGDAPVGPVDVDEVIRTVPAYAETTIEIADRESECTVPVYVGTVENWPR